MSEAPSQSAFPARAPHPSPTGQVLTCTESKNLLIEQWTLNEASESAGLLNGNGLNALLLVQEGSLECRHNRCGSPVRMASGDYIVVTGADQLHEVTGAATVVRCLFHGDVEHERFPETRRNVGALSVSNVFADRPRIVTVCETRFVRFDVVTSLGHASPGGRECDSSSHEWLLMLKGDTVFTIEGTEYPLTAGDTIYLPPGVPNGVRDTNVESGTVWMAVFYRGAIGDFDWQPRAAEASASTDPLADGRKMSAAARRLKAFRELQG
ncbi:cupin domain-containing protein [Phaeobacter sp. B1627]|uniref:cupin domain-containing protein n=1 Tax=Phaeobacter sp. B1627 TaxID=2583809 RepID=UPI00111BC849|nr:cupin domain-containing protein [Phaeobacter sp. B1627]TNJ42308.1 cupin domain-containing protein [Phaeobacter sp. B1627]